MTGESLPETVEAAPVPPRRRRWGRIVLGAGLGLLLVLLAALGLVDTAIGHRMIADTIAGLRPA
ncbi:hypothetical protein ABTE68_20705, partial [Acinetobacter baumannii]